MQEPKTDTKITVLVFAPFFTQICREPFVMSFEYHYYFHFIWYGSAHSQLNLFQLVDFPIL